MAVVIDCHTPCVHIAGRPGCDCHSHSRFFTMALAISSKAAFACRTAPMRRGMSVVRAGAQVNPDIKKDVEKVVDMLKAEELPKKAVFCRCWRSKKFPMCDGAHVKHNTETGDNVGPLIVEKAA